ncbi:uncharacterized protein LOC131051212 [Cryptomeria japonica]|uniref:uncharacterized protein LOC131051212 n=1 Tax=Cryptomeria japonica TaxID=3369 RepID=UPI0025AC1FCB|nr:uncharacterized protein LOC131051212 [Cryptomeria japonica]
MNSGGVRVNTENQMDEQGSTPLGLKLRKSPSLIELIHLSMCQRNGESSQGVNNLTMEEGNMQNNGCIGANSDVEEKKKATNFSAVLLRIGAWEYVSRYEGDLVAKCYFSKRKLVWEVLEGGLKSKIEIQWQDITGLNATCPQNELSTLEIEFSRPPMFFRESNPQPRKHTIWQATSDFTGGQATLYKRHFLQFPKGQLERHYQSLIQSDPRLKMLSKKSLPRTDSPFFETRFSPFGDQQSLYLRLLRENLCHAIPQSAFLSSNCYLPPLVDVEQNNASDYEQMKAEESFSGFSVSTSEDRDSWSSKRNLKLEELAQYLLGDGLLTSNHQEKQITQRVNSNLHSLWPKDYFQL